MAQVYGPGMLGTVVLVDPATGLPYKAEGGGSTEGGWVFGTWFSGGGTYEEGVVVADSDWMVNPDGALYVCIEGFTTVAPMFNPSQDTEHWAKVTPPVGNTVLSDATATYAYMGVAPTAHNNPATDPWYISRIALASPNTALHATGLWNDRATLTYA